VTKGGVPTKKEENRFTIRFNPADPKHRKTMGVLISAGRRKASLISDAICEYLARHDGDTAAVAVFYEKQTAPETTPSSASVPISQATDHAPADENIIDEDMRQSILDGLSMFSEE
jgi:hypothetical protein